MNVEPVKDESINQKHNGIDVGGSNPSSIDAVDGVLVDKTILCDVHEVSAEPGVIEPDKDLVDHRACNESPDPELFFNNNPHPSSVSSHTKYPGSKITKNDIYVHPPARSHPNVIKSKSKITKRPCIKLHDMLGQLLHTNDVMVWIRKNRMISGVIIGFSMTANDHPVIVVLRECGDHQYKRLRKKATVKWLSQCCVVNRHVIEPAVMDRFMKAKPGNRN